MCLPDIKAVYVNTRVIAYIFNKQVVGRHYTFCTEYCTVDFRTRAQTIIRKKLLLYYRENIQKSELLTVINRKQLNDALNISAVYQQ